MKFIYTRDVERGAGFVFRVEDVVSARASEHESELATLTDVTLEGGATVTINIDFDDFAVLIGAEEVPLADALL